jgi:hypothetical protein
VNNFFVTLDTFSSLFAVAVTPIISVTYIFTFRTRQMMHTRPDALFWGQLKTENTNTMTYQQTAVHLGVRVSTLRKWVSRKWIPVIRYMDIEQSGSI